MVVLVGFCYWPSDCLECVIKFIIEHFMCLFLCKRSSPLQFVFSGSSRRLQAKLLKRNVNGQLSPTVATRSSLISSSPSVQRQNSGVSLPLSRKDDKMSTITAGQEEKGVEKGEENELVPNDTSVDKKHKRKSSEIQVIPLLSPETDQGKKLLPQRSRSSKRLLSNKQPSKSADKKRVPLDSISCISDYSALSNFEFTPRNSSAGKKDQQEGTSPLTSKSLKDFTNSPEGR